MSQMRTAWSPTWERLHRLRRKLHSPAGATEPTYPLGLSAEEAKQVALWASHPGYAVLRVASETLYLQRVQQILTGTLTPEQYHHLTGYCKALEQMAALPETFAAAIARGASDGRRDAGPERPLDAIFYGTPEWGASRRMARPPE